jgi:hypothetical protein
VSIRLSNHVNYSEFLLSDDKIQGMNKCVQLILDDKRQFYILGFGPFGDKIIEFDLSVGRCALYDF